MTAAGGAAAGIIMDLLVVPFSFLLDAIVGDPQWMPHPVRLIGSWIRFFEKLLRNPEDPPEKQRFKGAVLTSAVLLLTGGLTGGVVILSDMLHPFFGMAVKVALCTFCLAAKSLKDASMDVYEQLSVPDLEKSRYAVSMIVGRDTERLDYEGVAKAAVESVAESASDGVIAPLFFLCLGGPVAGMLYKAVNTMDSTIGYKNDKYMYFGTAAAKLDDVVNFIPARLSAFLMIASCPLLGLDTAGAFRIFKRDRFNHASPNSAQTESVCAGALGVRLAGDAWYFGKLVKKPFIGDALRAVEKEDIRRANSLMYASALLGVVLFTGVRILCVTVARFIPWII